MCTGGDGTQVGLKGVGQRVGLAIVTSVGNQAVAERMPTRTLGLRGDLPRPGVALAAVHIVAGEPTDAAQQREGDLGPAWRRSILPAQYFVLGQSPVRQHHAPLAVAHVYKGPLWMGGDRLLGPVFGPGRQIEWTFDDVKVSIGAGGVHRQASGKVGAEPMVTRLVLDRRFEIHAAHAGSESDAGDDRERYRLIGTAGAIPRGQGNGHAIVERDLQGHAHFVVR